MVKQSLRPQSPWAPSYTASCWRVELNHLPSWWVKLSSPQRGLEVTGEGFMNCCVTSRTLRFLNASWKKDPVVKSGFSSCLLHVWAHSRLWEGPQEEHYIFFQIDVKALLPGNKFWKKLSWSQKLFFAYSLLSWSLPHPLPPSQSSLSFPWFDTTPSTTLGVYSGGHLWTYGPIFDFLVARRGQASSRSC